MTLLNLKDLSITLGQPLFTDLNLTLDKGDRIGLIAGNGRGKSTLLRAIAGTADITSGEITRSRGLRVGHLEQEVPAALLGMTLYDAVLNALPLAQVEYESWRVDVVLDGLKVPYEHQQKPLSALSGGWQRVALLARVWIMEPDVLLMDEPTNHLDIESIRWLEEFLLKFNNTVIVVSHDRHFLNKVCSHIADIDYGKISIYVGNYSFWQQASQLMARQQKDQQKKAETRAAELKAFIQRFSANASKSRQATSRMKELDKLDLDSLPRTSRRFPFCGFTPERELGKIVLEVEGLAKSLDGEMLFSGWDLNVQAGDKIGFVGPNNLAKSAFMDVIAGDERADKGSFNWGVTTKFDYFPKNNTTFFSDDMNMTDWLRQYSVEQEEAYIRGFLGRMLFTQDESLKKVKVLSGGEKVRCLLSKMMLSGANVLILDDPTGHLDLESITSLNNGLIDFSGAVIFASHDHQFINTIANRIIEFTPGGVIDRRMTFEEYLENEDVAVLRDKMYGGHHERLRI